MMSTPDSSVVIGAVLALSAKLPHLQSNAYQMLTNFLSVLLFDPYSQIDDDIAGRLRAANEKVAGGRLFEWLGSVDDCPGNQAALTVVTKASAAGPKSRGVARFGQLHNALIFRGVP